MVTLAISLALFQLLADTPPLYGNPPDEHAGVLVPKYICSYGVLPTGLEEELRIPGYGSSYGLYTVFPYIVQGYVMRLVNVFTDSELALLYSARMVNAGVVICFCIFLCGTVDMVYFRALFMYVITQADGHTVGNHTYHHPDMSKLSDRDSFKKELDDVSALFKEITGTELSMYYRPPQGKYSINNLQMAQELGYSTFFWSLAYVDWNQDKQPRHEEAFKKLCGRIHPGAVVLLHSTSKTNGEIMDELLTKWEEMGYTFRPLSDFVEGIER